jgi:hypothetical protein
MDMDTGKYPFRYRHVGKTCGPAAGCGYCDAECNQHENEVKYFLEGRYLSS